MFDRRSTVATALCLLLLAMRWAPALQAEQRNISQQDWQETIHAQVVAHGATFTQLLSFKALEKATDQAVQIQGTGTNPNYKVELLCSMDDPKKVPGASAIFTKPEIGGDLGTFTDANVHFITLFAPICLQHKLKITELGNVNSITIQAYEGSQ